MVQVKLIRDYLDLSGHIYITFEFQATLKLSGIKLLGFAVARTLPVSWALSDAAEAVPGISISGSR